MNLINDPEKLQFVKDNYYTLGPVKVSNYLACSRCTVLRMAKKLKMDTSCSFVKRQLKNKTQLLNDPLYDNFYNLNDREIAYILGFLWADGHISTSVNGTNGHRVICSISDKDAPHIRKIFLKKAPWKEKFFTQKLNGKNYSMYKILIHNKTLVRWLESLDFSKKSTFFPEKIINLLNEECLTAFIAGFFDGDGSFHFDPKGVYRTIIAGNYFSDTESWVKFFSKYQIVCNVRRLVSKKGHKSSNLDICDINSNKNFICNFIEPNRDLILPRKMVNFDKFLNHTFGRKDWSKIHRKKMKLINEQETLIFNSGDDAARFLKVHRSSIGSALSRKHKCKGFIVELINE